MNELRRDPITGRWVILFLDKITELSEIKPERRDLNADNCPFCYGREHETPHEIIAHRVHGASNTPGWSVRVVPNKYPALRIEGDLDKEGVGLFDMMNGVGAHEVVVETPDHFKDIGSMSDQEVEEIVWVYQARSIDLRRDKRFKYILIFKNYGKSAGASLEHPHSQIIALPVVPKVVQEELDGSAKYFDYKGRCVFCDMIRQEEDEKDRIIYQNKEFMAFCPYVSRSMYEVWILPKKHKSEFSSMDRDSVALFAAALRDVLARIKNLLRNPSYNFIIHTSPINGHEREDYHWHVEIVPKLARIAGFEWGSGFYVNSVPPDIAAKNLLNIKIVLPIF